MEYIVADEAEATPTMNKPREPIAIVHPNAAGLDSGAREISACVPPDRTGETIKVFGTFTPRRSLYPQPRNIQNVALQSLKHTLG